jgi:hypothetical protein
VAKLSVNGKPNSMVVSLVFRDQGFFPCSMTGTITHVVGGSVITMWLEFVVIIIIIWKFS